MDLLTFKTVNTTDCNNKSYINMRTYARFSLSGYGDAILKYSKRRMMPSGHHSHFDYSLSSLPLLPNQITDVNKLNINEDIVVISLLHIVLSTFWLCFKQRFWNVMGFSKNS